MTTIARVTWVSPEEGGRQRLPETNRYVTVSKFAEDGPGWPDGAWSVVVDFPQPPSVQGNPSSGVASFLMDTAPKSRLVPGARFELYEGLRRVATVELF
jgi:hypothetical protein